MTVDYNVQYQELRFAVGVDYTSNVHLRLSVAIIEIYDQTITYDHGSLKQVLASNLLQVFIISRSAKNTKVEERIRETSPILGEYTRFLKDQITGPLKPPWA